MAKIGLPSLKLNNVGQKSKSCGDFRSVAEEALKERKGHDPDIDQSKVDQNIYTGYQTAAELIEYSRSHVEQLKDKNGRGIRKDAVVMCATILKPPADFMNRLSQADQLRFLADAERIFVEIVGEKNVKATAIHFDELGTHEHVFWEPMTADGRLCAKEVHNLKFFSRVNRELPQKLREAGWEIEDCEMYDAAKKEYEQEMEKAEKSEAGRSSARFKAEAERQKQELQVEIGELEEMKQDLERITDELTDKANEYGFEARVNQQRAEDAVKEAEKAEKTVSVLNQDISTLSNKKASLEAEIGAQKDKMDRLVADEVKRRVEDLPVKIDSRPVPMSKEKVIVNATDLEKLERRTGLSKVYEESIAVAEEQIYLQLTDTVRRAEEARRLREQAAKEKAEAAALKQKEQELYNHQLDLNNDFQKLAAGTEKLKKKNEALEQENAALKSEISGLRAEIVKIRENLTEQIERLKSRLIGAYEKISNVVQAVGMLKYDKTDGYKIEKLSRKQERIIDGVAEYAADVVRKDCPDIAEDIEKHIGLSEDLQKVVEPKQRQREIER